MDVKERPDELLAEPKARRLIRVVHSYEIFMVQPLIINNSCCM
jgi:hypothetical protein